jgi:hypothetical protein
VVASFVPSSPGFDPSERVLDAVMAKVPVEKKEGNGG